MKYKAIGASALGLIIFVWIAGGCSSKHSELSKEQRTAKSLKKYERAVERRLEREFDSPAYSNEICKSIQQGCFGPKYYYEWQSPSGNVVCQCQDESMRKKE